MATNNVAQFAAELNMPSDVLLKQLRDAGVDKNSADDILSKEDKDKLLSFLRGSHGSPSGEKRKIRPTKRNGTIAESMTEKRTDPEMDSEGCAFCNIVSDLCVTAEEKPLWFRMWHRILHPGAVRHSRQPPDRLRRPPEFLHCPPCGR